MIIFCGQSSATTDITLQLKWTHQFQFAGYYMAQQQGFYQAAGLNVTILPADPDNPDTFSNVLSGQAQFGVAHSGILQQRIAGKPLVAMAAILQFSPYCWMVKKSSDIFHPRDFADKRISSISRKENAELLVMLERSGIQTDDLPAYAGDSSSEDWLAGAIDAMQVYVTNEPYTMREQGIDHRLICPQKYGINVYSDILYTTENMLRQHPQEVEAFYQASLKGWRYAMMHMDEAIALTQHQYAPDRSFAQLAYEAEVLSDYILPAGTNLGAMSIAKWRLIADLYAIEQSAFNQAQDGFIYQYAEPEKINMSWMLIAAIIISLLSIPLYLRLMLRKSV
ncbi:ABC transporter substrate-binding protein [Pseudoalteromonas haloplanktis]|uniref:Thiamine pyrimidine synthase n=1 Tax=Pseudoalteromonas haloplanktis TaxID=228 RepID=A0ABU1BE53_PSEHA|nr:MULTISPECIES: ABC transporter substrate-binding protein [Pseudoalteromonas]MDQ9092783.1 ABC transporter substrate-binding protein [Pseudoalteromonas haloplanktis]